MIRYGVSLFLVLFLSVSSVLGQISVSENNRYLVKADGTPFLWLGDTGWGLFQNLNREEVDIYLRKRAEQGFTIVHSAVVHKNPFIVPELVNVFGDKAFVNEDLMKPALTGGNSPDNDLEYDYWDHVDYIIKRAGEYGIHIVFLPVFGMAEGEGYNLITPGNAYDYGLFLGKRYKNEKNIIWCMGGDVLAQNEQRKATWNTLAKGITEGVAGKEDYTRTLMTFHVRGGHSSSEYFPDAPWLDFHMIQTWASYTTIYDMLGKDYNNALVKPVVHGEGAYEDGPEYPNKPITPHKIRKQAYWAAFAGGMHTYGNSNIWSFGTNPKYLTREWKEALSSEGAQSMSVYQDFFRSVNWWDFVPDPSVILEGAGAGDSLNVAMSSASTNQIMVYLSEQSELKLALNQLRGSGMFTGEWINPLTGERRDAGAFESEKPVSVQTPKGWEDALLLLIASQ